MTALGKSLISDETRAALRSLIARRQPGHTLESPFYTSDEIFALDMESIFRRHWIQVAVEPDVAEAGDYVTVEIGLDSILIRARRRHADAGVPQCLPPSRCDACARRRKAASAISSARTTAGPTT